MRYTMIYRGFVIDKRDGFYVISVLHRAAFSLVDACRMIDREWKAVE